ncbi:MAG: protein translocase subunit SecF [Candidatus Nealsonbacteria bacterium]|nr:MAG: protein translocase subunit SecF [Candidatus Nealsonbacteria bacterium]
MSFNFIRYSKIYFTFSGILILGSLVSLFVFGLNPGIDFTGGSIMELHYQGSRPEVSAVRESLSEFGPVYVQTTGDKGLIIRMKDIPEETHQQILQILSDGYQVEERRFESIGPVIGRELKEKTKLLIAVALFSVVFYVALAFRKVQRPIASWQYGIVSLVALFHDVLIPIGVFSVLGKLYGVQITIPVVAALLTILGYSINDTVVVFDRIRENLIKRVGVTFEETVNKSLNQTVARSINTSLTTLLVLLAIYFFGGATLQYFALALIIGILAGTYSSIFLASPLLVFYLTRFKKYV